MTDFKETLLKLNNNLQILQQREVKHGPDNAPLDLLNQITDHKQAITLTEQALDGELTEAAWREALRPLLVNIRDRSEAQPADCGVSIGDVEGGIMASIIAGGDVSNAQIAHDEGIAQASHGGQAEVNMSTVDQPGQQVSGDQYNAARDINIYNPPAAPTSPAPPRRGVYVIAGLLVGIVVNVAVNLLSAAIQQKYFADQFSTQAMWGLAIFAVGGSLVGLWLSGLVPIPASAAPPQAKPIPTNNPNQVMITRFRAFLSLGKLRGKGITIADILLIGSKLDIDTRSSDDSSHH